MSAESIDFDLAAAWSRRMKGDMRAFAEGLAARLDAALPGNVEIERRRDGFLSRTSHVARIAVRFDDVLLSLSMHGNHLTATRAKIVRGVTIGTEEMAIPAWLDALAHKAGADGERAGAGHEALHAFLMS